MTILEERVEAIEERTDRLETLFGQFMLQTGSALSRIESTIAEMKADSARDREESARFRQEIKEESAIFRQEIKEESARDREESAIFRQEMKEEAARDREESARFRQEIKEESARDREESARFRQEMKAESAIFRQEIKEESARDREESARFRREMNKRWGDLANRMGTIVEDIIAPSLRRMAREEFDCGEERFFGARVSRTRSDNSSLRREFDVLYIGAQAVLLNETKSTPHSEDARAFVDFLNRGEFALYFPECQEMAIVPVFSSLHIPADLVTYLTRNRIYAVAMGEEVMQALNNKDEAVWRRPVT